MRRFGIDVDLILVHRDMEGVEWEVTPDEDGNFHETRIGTYWTNGSFP